MSTKKRDEVAKLIEAELEPLSIEHNELKLVESERSAAMQKAGEPFNKRVDELTESVDKRVAEIVRLVEEHREVLFDTATKTLELRSGKLNIKRSPGTLVVKDEGKVMRYLRRVGKLRAYTRVGKRSLDKNALKNNPEFVEKAPGMFIDRPETLTIKPAKSQAAIIENLDRFKRNV